MTRDERSGSGSRIAIAVAIIGLASAVVTSPSWGQQLCLRLGFCQADSNGPTQEAKSGGDGSHSGTSSKHRTKPSADSTEGSPRDTPTPPDDSARWSCPGGTFCGWDGPQGTGSLFVQKDATCALHDIGSAGLGDRLTSYQNRTGKKVTLYNWTGTEWQTLVEVADGEKGDVPQSANNTTDAVKVCD